MFLYKHCFNNLKFSMIIIYYDYLKLGNNVALDFIAATVNKQFGFPCIMD